MPHLLRSILAFCTFGLCAVGCTKTHLPAEPAGATDVVLKVPEMH